MRVTLKPIRGLSDENRLKLAKILQELGVFQIRQ